MSEEETDSYPFNVEILTADEDEIFVSE